MNQLLKLRVALLINAFHAAGFRILGSLGLFLNIQQICQAVESNNTIHAARRERHEQHIAAKSRQEAADKEKELKDLKARRDIDAGLRASRARRDIESVSHSKAKTLPAPSARKQSKPDKPAESSRAGRGSISWSERLRNYKSSHGGSRSRSRSRTRRLADGRYCFSYMNKGWCFV